MAHCITETDWVAAEKDTWHHLHKMPVPGGVESQLAYYGQNLAAEAPVFIGDDYTQELFNSLIAGNWGRCADIIRERPFSIPAHAEGYKAVIREKDRKLHQIASGSYSICQFSELAKLADSMLESGRYGLATCGTLNAGSNMFISLRLQAITIAGPADTIQRFRNLIGSHDGSQPVVLGDSNIRIVCFNTYRNFLEGIESCWSLRHSGDMSEKLVQLARIIENADAAGLTFDEQCKKLANLELSGDALTEYLSNYWSEYYLESVDSGPSARVQKLREDRKLKAFQSIKSRIELESLKLGVGHSAWLAVQAVNHFEATKSERLKSRSMVERMYSDSPKDAYLFGSALALVG